jgi:bile acid-coenzyme A ligase
MSLADEYLEPSGMPRVGAPMAALLAAQAEREPNRPALTFPGRTLTRIEIEKTSNQKARQLAEAGVGQDDVVIIALDNSIAYYQIAFGLWKLGATPLHVSNKLTPREFDEIVELSKPKLVITENTTLAQDGAAGYSDEPLPIKVSSRWKVATSGGSTGRPKLIVDPFSAVWGPDKLNVRRPPESTIVNAGPLFHSAPFWMMNSALMEGSHVVEMGGFDPVRYMELVERYKANWAYLVPTTMARIAKAKLELGDQHDLTSIKTLIHMASICPPWVKRAWIEMLGPDAVWEVYAGTERTGATQIGGAEWLQHPGSVGKPRPGFEVGIFGEDGEKVPTGQVGEIFFHKLEGPPPPVLYIGAEPRRLGDWMSYGDMGWLDEEGYLYLADRRTDMIVCDGLNIYPAEIEGQINELDGVVESVVVGAPHDDLGQCPHAFVELKPNASGWTERSLIEAIRDRLATYKLPRGVTFVKEPIRNEAGKVRRSLWRDRAASETLKAAAGG